MKKSKLQFKIKKLFKSLKEEIQSYKVVYSLLVIVLIISAFLRLYKLDQLLGFYYDQGRDALVIWRLLHEGKFFLIGPVTGIEGIFLGPFYYYLIALFYFLGGGSPVLVAAALNLITVFGIYLLFLVTKESFDRRVALLASFFVATSYSLVTFSRWLSHPPLLSTFSLLIIYALLKIYRGKERWWFVVGLVGGLCLQLEAAGAIPFLFTIFIFVLWQRKKIKSLPIILSSFLSFFSTLIPQIVFNWRHQGILWQVFQRFLVGEKSFSLPFLELAKQRLSTYFGVFFSKFFYSDQDLRFVWLGIFLFLGFLKRREIFKDERKILWLWFLVPLVSYLFYQGNYGYFWDYYLSGVWLVFVIFVAFLLISFWSKIWGKLVFFLFLVPFLFINFSRLSVYFQTGIGIIIRDQLLAIDWIYQDTDEKNFNVDVYVPPVIPYAYDYLLKWYGLKKYGREPQFERVSLLYTLYEVDSPHPERLTKWLERQEKIGRIIKEKTFGSITVQQRERINEKKN